jgi:hypothetical protein
VNLELAGKVVLVTGGSRGRFLELTEDDWQSNAALGHIT